MRIYVLCNIHTDWTGENEEFRDVTTVQAAVVEWAKRIVKANEVHYVTCKVYDDVGVLMDRVDLKKTAANRRVVLV